MPKIQKHKASEQEKRLKILEQQLYGNIKIINESKAVTPNMPTSHQDPRISDVTYLKQDLTKISLLASLAIGVQFIIKIFFERG